MAKNKNRNDPAPPEKVYITLGGESETEYIEKKSVFYGSARRITDVGQAADFIRKVTEKYPDATHHVYAYQIGGGSAERCSDDGEPQGTSGPPVLDYIKKSGFTDAVIVVTRYFGGILLGAGGLTRAYTAAAAKAAEAAGIVRFVEYAELRAKMSYSDYGRVEKLLSDIGAKIDGVSYGDGVECRFAVRAPEKDLTVARITDLTAARAAVEVTGSRFDS
ncbi:MAG: YigZ family protein [Clostridiales bacterium]|nr:YigZ family protein [Clostridiales bacterium]